MSLRDLITGILLTFAGVGFVLAGISYGVGSFGRMGAGFFPVGLGIIVAVLGLAIAVSGALASGSEPIEMPNWRALAGVVVAVGLFAATVGRLGLMPATALCAAALALAEPGNRLRHVVLLSIGLAVSTGLIFINLLGMPIAALRLP
ncbi:tripartite tricarboxylate transporter TctB family protein [Aurantimonas sp. A2-1-M11]|uniref:tripartite tricarboxylate transporter TctB family protein n=1 Tax=Aurantimonas sp. A2-1-M11 TaxID=3113712 RepID=UPI002F94D707